jgi:hypothetical protein
VLAELVRGAVDDTVSAQIRRRAQEPQITSKIARELEHRLNGGMVARYKVTVIAQDFSAHGPKSGESHSGADLYVGIRVEDGVDPKPVAKGLLVQSKKTRTGLFRKADGELLKHVVTEQAELVHQCEKMLSRTKPNGAFVWLYGATGAEVVPAQEVLEHPLLPPELLGRRNVAEHFRDVLDCFQGDPDLVTPNIFDNDSALGDFMEEIAVRRAVVLKLTTAER